MAWGTSRVRGISPKKQKSEVEIKQIALQQAIKCLLVLYTCIPHKNESKLTIKTNISILELKNRMDNHLQINKIQQHH